MKELNLSTRLDASLALREALGVSTRACQRLLRDFVAYVEKHGEGRYAPNWRWTGLAALPRLVALPDKPRGSASRAVFWPISKRACRKPKFLTNSCCPRHAVRNPIFSLRWKSAACWQRRRAWGHVVRYGRIRIRRFSVCWPRLGCDRVRPPNCCPLLQQFFVEYLCNQKRVSPQTIASYRDTFRLLLEFIRDQHGSEPAAVALKDLEVPVILAFLDHLEQARHNSIRLRNLRLAALRSFFCLVALREPAYVAQAAQVLAIPVKRTDHQLVKALTRAEMEAMLAAPDLNQWSGRRDHALLLTLITVERVFPKSWRWSSRSFVSARRVFCTCTGRQKERAVPLWTKTARALQAWFKELSGRPTSLAFFSARGKKLTRNGWITFCSKRWRAP